DRAIDGYRYGVRPGAERAASQVVDVLTRGSVYAEVEAVVRAKQVVAFGDGSDYGACDSSQRNGRGRQLAGWHPVAGEGELHGYTPAFAAESARPVALD